MAAIYLDSSALVKLAVHDVGSDALRKHLRRRRPLMSSALARTEVLRALLPGGELALAAGRRVLSRVDLVRVNDAVLSKAGTMLPAELRSLDAIHIATAGQIERTWPRSSPTTSGWRLPLALWATRSHRQPDHIASQLPPAPRPPGERWHTSSFLGPGARGTTCTRRS